MSLVETLPALPVGAPVLNPFSQNLWAPEREDSLRALWSVEPHLSCRAIGILLGVTKNAVIGKVDRMGLPKRVRASVARAIKPPRPQKAKPAIVRPPVPQSPDAPLNLTLLELKKGQCKFTESDGSPFLFCGRPQDPISPYCPFHHALTHMPMPKKDRLPSWVRT